MNTLRLGLFTFCMIMFFGSYAQHINNGRSKNKVSISANNSESQNIKPLNEETEESFVNHFMNIPVEALLHEAERNTRWEDSLIDRNHDQKIAYPQHSREFSNNNIALDIDPDDSLQNHFSELFSGTERKK